MGMPRNPKNKRIAVSFRLPPELVDEIDAQAAARVIGRNLLVDHLLRAGLDHLAPIPDGWEDPRG